MEYVTVQDLIAVPLRIGYATDINSLLRVNGLRYWMLVNATDVMCVFLDANSVQLHLIQGRKGFKSMHRCVSVVDYVKTHADKSLFLCMTEGIILAFDMTGEEDRKMSIPIREIDLPPIHVRVDQDKCNLPMMCSYKCFEKCPQGVFHVYGQKSGKFLKSDPTQPKNFITVGQAHAKCTGCMICVEKCPENAITIKLEIPQIESEEHPYRHPFENVKEGWENYKIMEQNDAKHLRG